MILSEQEIEVRIAQLECEKREIALILAQLKPTFNPTKDEAQLKQLGWL